MCQSEWPSLSEQITSMTQGTLIRKDRGPKGHNPAGWQDPGLPFASRAHGWKHQGTWNYYDRDLWSKTNIAHMVSVWRSPPLNICKHAFVNQVTITILCALLCPKYFDIRDRYQLHISWRNWNTNVFWQYSIHRWPRVHMEGRSRRSSSLRHCFLFFSMSATPWLRPRAWHSKSILLQFHVTAIFTCLGPSHRRSLKLDSRNSGLRSKRKFSSVLARSKEIL